MAGSVRLMMYSCIFCKSVTVPERNGLGPGYRHRGFPPEDRQSSPCLAGSRNEPEEFLNINKDADINPSSPYHQSTLNFASKACQRVWHANRYLKIFAGRDRVAEERCGTAGVQDRGFGADRGGNRCWRRIIRRAGTVHRAD